MLDPDREDDQSEAVFEEVSYNLKKLENTAVNKMLFFAVKSATEYHGEPVSFYQFC